MGELFGLSHCFKSAKLVYICLRFSARLSFIMAFALELWPSNCFFCSLNSLFKALSQNALDPGCYIVYYMVSHAHCSRVTSTHLEKLFHVDYFAVEFLMLHLFFSLLSFFFGVIVLLA